MTDRQRFEHRADGFHRLVRPAPSSLFLSVISVLTIVVLLTSGTPSDAETLGIYSADDRDDAGLNILAASEVLPPMSIPPLQATDAGIPLSGDSWSARMTRTLMTVRDRAPPPEDAIGRISLPAPPSVPVKFTFPPASVATEAVAAPFHEVPESIQKLEPGSR